MAQITAADVKKLREMSGAGMMDCKKALAACDGDIDASVDYLRTHGLAAASKKAGRVAAEGMVVALSEGDTGIVIEVNAETDFSSKNDTFTSFVNAVAELALAKKPADVEALKALDLNGATVQETLTKLIATIGENMAIRRYELAQVKGGVVSAYVHGAGKIGVLIGISGGNSAELQDLGRGVAMHVAAVNPQYINRNQVSEDAVERERAVLTERAAGSGKPANIIDKIVSGQMSKFYSEVCLLEQEYVMNGDLTVGKAVQAVQADAEVVVMHRFQLGEGIEKKESDFAAEVAAQING
ncbi:MAG: elongation factor Ts [Zetaproteobacteria bacterium CG12_big_fil_rev_8_21_14_0_65_55_1124]|nr:MAG: translation elongation factor Ts [Zetaproteobacteria bacterium CG1_02_55_237]PIS19898.1 MAG: elongation factor Ts [Zetaproteobacteria bacterium CG08_land_8_20_14_0_20_55_17]PIW42560.1 MAG: elongation factor Ts [Zetaproteobacteria bacterium CG12_big_fil_rev_8_21_14_0_65_55_1124]PIY51290.1 MAG: elongation factor Ts [Zetaproteobacteria bacterium CG_4_10_14_0_8_um_filter_55_43]PIZ36644.1 MAG: elongation factor Ts [Zetaproteobacteria bacterium CG_4_10_14_0_2_um_filter_55_20]PJB80211.1 MAG: 